MIGQTVSHYKILEHLGEGGMGVVYKASDTKLERIVAMKFLPQPVSASAETKARFLQEARAAASLNHPNICTIHGIEESDETVFIVMEYVDGGTLRSKLPFARMDEALTIALQVGDGLQEAHAHGVIHRDIKADNVMLTSKGQAKVMDFGLARLKDSLKLTKAPSTVGTLGYMAPEVIQGGQADFRSDIFSFGVLLFEMLTGKLPFRGEHEAAIMYSIINEEPESILKLEPGYPSELDRILRRTLEKDPADRYQHIDDAVSELRKLMKPTGAVTRPPVSQVDNKTTVSRPKATKSSILIGIVLLGLAIAAWYLFSGKSTTAITSMAVLPFVNAGADPSLEYLSDGLTEGLINSLSRLPGVKMISRNTVFHFKGREVDPQDLGKRLNVRAIVLGRLEKHGGTLDVSAELVSTVDDSHLWGERYSSSSSDILALEGEIAKALSKELHSNLTGAQTAAIIDKTTQNSGAYQSYLKGMFQLRKRSLEGFDQALRDLSEAVRADSTFALAYAGLSDCYNLMGAYYAITPGEARTKGKEMALKALSLNDNLVQAHTGLASISESYEWNWKVAEQEYRRAIQIDPNYATAHQWYSELLCALGRHEEAAAQIKLAEQLDPLSPAIFTSGAFVRQYAGDLEDAITHIRGALEVDPHFPRAHVYLAQILCRKGNIAEAFKEYHFAVAYGDSADEFLTGLGCLYSMAGERVRGAEILRKFLDKSRRTYFPPYLIAELYATLGDKESALQSLDRAYDERTADLEFLTYDIFLKSLRTDARFAELIRKVGLPGTATTQ